jgi:LPXTG-motif cell wall-anchored protein
MEDGQGGPAMRGRAFGAPPGGWSRVVFPLAAGALGVGLLGAAAGAAPLPSADAVAVILGTVSATTANLTVTPNPKLPATTADVTVYDQNGHVLDSDQAVTGLPNPVGSPTPVTWAFTANYTPPVKGEVITGLQSPGAYELARANATNTVLLSVYANVGTLPPPSIVPFVIPPTGGTPTPSLPVPSVPPAAHQPTLPQTGGGRVLEAVGVLLLGAAGWLALGRSRRT